MSDIHTALAAVMADAKSVAKRDRNTHQNFMFRGIDAVVNAVGPILRTHHVIVVPNVRNVAYDGVHTTNDKPATACRVVVEYVFYAPDGSSLACIVAGEAWDHGDKATPKAMSVAFRTALLQALALPTDEADPDTQTYEQEGPPRRATRTSRPDPADPWATPEPVAGPRGPSREQLRLLHTLMSEAGITDRASRLAYAGNLIGREVASSSDLTAAEASRTISALRALVPVKDPAETTGEGEQS